MISKTIGYNGVHYIFRHTQILSNLQMGGLLKRWNLVAKVWAVPTSFWQGSWVAQRGERELVASDSHGWKMLETLPPQVKIGAEAISSSVKSAVLQGANRAYRNGWYVRWVLSMREVSWISLTMSHPAQMWNRDATCYAMCTESWLVHFVSDNQIHWAISANQLHMDTHGPYV